MAKDYYLEHMTGVRQTCEEFLAGLLAGTFNYYSAEHDAIVVRVNGDYAEMIGRSRVMAAVYGGGKKRWRLQGDFTLRKEEGAFLYIFIFPFTNLKECLKFSPSELRLVGTSALWVG